ncbi:hypothetical protein GCM10018952_66960 [Streptosporangium vulgare]
MPTAGASVCSVTFLLAESLTATYSPETVVGPLGLAIEAICHRQEPLKIRKRGTVPVAAPARPARPALAAVGAPRSGPPGEIEASRPGRRAGGGASSRAPIRIKGVSRGRFLDPDYRCPITRSL